MYKYIIKKWYVIFGTALVLAVISGMLLKTMQNSGKDTKDDIIKYVGGNAKIQVYEELKYYLILQHDDGTLTDEQDRRLEEILKTNTDTQKVLYNALQPELYKLISENRNQEFTDSLADSDYDTAIAVFEAYMESGSYLEKPAPQGFIMSDALKGAVFGTFMGILFLIILFVSTSPEK
ncbi:hypothetical protein [Butyrivibrio sp. FCS014]|uniref:hypothetical protein n=1 Tax=Butyrivibrio sp. FCS014 TaxID=1408304 RepID=UPI00046527D0|nr:hypothetical protein [Butyrivibrio sp. FCS014]